uniref:Photosystem I reaction center subunit VIII n=1 Tax=Polysiphonia sertularioides TaxID=945028 RepID=A0A1Z1MFR9_9FLOR|nr:photosystem I reaction center subunit VIII [Polysiphonia sertularioides]
MTSSYLPSILVPIVGILFPAIGMSLLFIYIEKDSIS